MKQIKERFSAEQRAEIFRDFAAQLRAKYDGVHYLYESKDAQDEIIRVLKFTDIVAMNYPVGLVPASS